MSTSPERLTRAIRWLQAYAALLTIALVVLFFRSGTSADDVLRTRGLIIEDEAGRERILIGAPIPEAANRVRTAFAPTRPGCGRSGRPGMRTGKPTWATTRTTTTQPTAS